MLILYVQLFKFISSIVDGTTTTIIVPDPSGKAIKIPRKLEVDDEEDIKLVVKRLERRKYFDWSWRVKICAFVLDNDDSTNYVGINEPFWE